MSNQPSQIAKDAAKAFELDHFGDWPGDEAAAVKFQGAIDDACVGKDKEIEELKAELWKLKYGEHSLEKLTARVKELETAIAIYREEES